MFLLYKVFLVLFKILDQFGFYFKGKLLKGFIQDGDIFYLYFRKVILVIVRKMIVEVIRIRVGEISQVVILGDKMRGCG